MRKNEIILQFGIWEFEDILPNDITKILNIEPFRIYIKGERRSALIPTLAKKNGWVMGSLCDKYASFEDQLNDLLDRLEPKIDLLKPFCDKYYCEFSCAVYIYQENEESTPSIHLNARYNEFVQKLNVEFDLDLYAMLGIENEK